MVHDNSTIYLFTYILESIFKLSRSVRERFAGRHILIYVGTISRIYQVEEILDLAGELRSRRRDFVVLICGEGPDRKTYQALAASRGLDDVIHFEGRIQRQEVASYLDAASVLLFPFHENRHNLALVPYAKMRETPAPPQTLPRPKNIFADFLDAVRAGKTETAVPFEYGTQLTEFAILGNLAMKAGQGNKVLWDGPNMKVTNLPELNAWVQRPSRAGWKA